MRPTLTLFAASALIGIAASGCRPEDPRDHPSRIFEFSGTRVDHYRALAGMRTREEFVRLCVDELKVQVEKARRDPEAHRKFIRSMRNLERRRLQRRR